MTYIARSVVGSSAWRAGVRACVRACVRTLQKDSLRKGRERTKFTLCAFVCVCERERERERADRALQSWPIRFGWLEAPSMFETRSPYEKPEGKRDSCTALRPPAGRTSSRGVHRKRRLAIVLFQEKNKEHAYPFSIRSSIRSFLPSLFLSFPPSSSLPTTLFSSGPVASGRSGARARRSPSS